MGELQSKGKRKEKKGGGEKGIVWCPEFQGSFLSKGGGGNRLINSYYVERRWGGNRLAF